MLPDKQKTKVQVQEREARLCCLFAAKGRAGKKATVGCEKCEREMGCKTKRQAADSPVEMK